MKSLKNSVRLIGNLGGTPDVKNLGDNRKLARFSVATNESYKNEKGERVTTTQWHTIVAWGSNATYAEKYLTKGSEVVLEGKLTYREYTDKSDVKRSITEIVVDSISKLNYEKQAA